MLQFANKIMVWRCQMGKNLILQQTQKKHAQNVHWNLWLIFSSRRHYSSTSYLFAGQAHIPCNSLSGNCLERWKDSLQITAQIYASTRMPLGFHLETSSSIPLVIQISFYFLFQEIKHKISVLTHLTLVIFFFPPFNPAPWFKTYPNIPPPLLQCLHLHLHLEQRSILGHLEFSWLY